MKILIVLTSHDQLGDTGKKTGFWLEEFAAPYYVLEDAGAVITLASPNGGQPPLDPKSDEPDFQTEATERFKGDRDAQTALASTVKLSDISPVDCDAVFYPGGHGPMWDLAEDRNSIALIEAMYASGKPVAILLSVTDWFREGLNKPVLDFSDQENQKCGFCFSSFSMACSHRKWWHIHVPRKL